VLDPFGKIPEFKYCAVRVTPGGEPAGRMSFGGGTLLAATDPAATPSPQ
jgi:formate dehydrogenase major subunit